LYTLKEEGLVLSARIGKHAPPAILDEMVQEYLSKNITDEEDDTAHYDGVEASSTDTFDWLSQEGERHIPILLGHYTPKGFTVSGVAFLFIDPEQSFNFPSDTVVSISKIFVDSGDVSSIHTEG